MEWRFSKIKEETYLAYDKSSTYRVILHHFYLQYNSSYVGEMFYYDESQHFGRNSLLEKKIKSALIHVYEQPFSEKIV